MAAYKTYGCQQFFKIFSLDTPLDTRTEVTSCKMWITKKLSCMRSEISTLTRGIKYYRNESIIKPLGFMMPPQNHSLTSTCLFVSPHFSTSTLFHRCNIDIASGPPWGLPTLLKAYCNSLHMLLVARPWRLHNKPTTLWLSIQMVSIFNQYAGNNHGLAIHMWPHTINCANHHLVVTMLKNFCYLFWYFDWDFY